jgi:DNA-binding ferritin-like protein (Dps family)
LASEGMSSQETDRATEGGCDLVDPGNACSIEPVINEDNESTTVWRLSLKEAILSPTDVPPVLSEVYDRLEEIFNLNQENVEALGNEIDKFIDTYLNGVIKQMNNLTDEKENKSHNKPHNKLKKTTVIQENGFHTHVARTFLKNVQRGWPMSLLTKIAHTLNQPGNHRQQLISRDITKICGGKKDQQVSHL